MAGPDDHRAFRAGRWLSSAALVLAAVAAAALALGSDDPRLLRLGIVAALWAALMGAFAVVRMRREIAGAADLRAIYRLELDREVAARREHELTVERDLRRELEQESRQELAAVRAELATLREEMQQLFGGELLVERVALRAESTRVRSLPDQNLAGSTARRALEVSSEPEPGRWRPQVVESSPPLPRRDPDARTDLTVRRPRPEPPPAWDTAATPWEPAQEIEPEPLAATDAGDGRHRTGVAPDVFLPDERRRVPESGAHRGGRSVNELLAANGARAGSSRHRRRADD